MGDGTLDGAGLHVRLPDRSGLTPEARVDGGQGEEGGEGEYGGRWCWDGGGHGGRI